jgi:hypothetical protein
VRLSILYRGPLESCNYGCDYCPFAKVKEGPEALARDERALARFVDWVASRERDRIAVFFTPWGEALIRPWYQAALARLTRLPNVDKAAVQTNLSCRLDWVAGCDTSKLALWATYHPGEVSRARFVDKCLEADRLGVRFSAGIVGLREHLDEAEALRAALPDHVYVWVNAYKRVADYYSEAEVARLEAVDPLFRLNTIHHPSLGRSCRAGVSVISVDGDGTARRCHFVKTPIGNIYDGGLDLVERACPNATCGCHIGYVHLDHLELGKVFGSGILERIPTARLWSKVASG